MRTIISLLFCAALVGCKPDETVTNVSNPSTYVTMPYGYSFNATVVIIDGHKFFVATTSHGDISVCEVTEASKPQ